MMESANTPWQCKYGYHDLLHISPRLHRV